MLHEVVAHSIQQLKKGYCLDGDIPDARATKKKRSGGDAGGEEYKRQMTKCNEQMSTMNQTALGKRIDLLQGQATELRRMIRKMKKDGEPEEDIKEEEEVMGNVKKQLEEAQEKLGHLASAHQRSFQQANEGGEADWEEYNRVHVTGD